MFKTFKILEFHQGEMVTIKLEGESLTLELEKGMKYETGENEEL